MRILNDILHTNAYFDMWRHAIYIGYRGSLAHGTHVPGSNPGSIDDKDVFGIVIPPPEWQFGLRVFEHLEVKRDVWDVLVYDFRKFIRLLIKCNPNVLQALWTPTNMVLKTSWQFEMLVENRQLFAHKGVYKSFCGYSQGQLHKMENMAYNGYMGEKRKALVDKFGFDCKNAQHLIRLLRQGIEFLNTGDLIVDRPDKDELIAIKTGNWSLDRIKNEAHALFAEMNDAYEKSKLPDKPDTAAIDALVQHVLKTTYRDQL